MNYGPLQYDYSAGKALERKLEEALARIDDLELAVVALCEQDGEVTYNPKDTHGNHTE